MNMIRWLVSNLPKQARALVGALLIAVFALSGVIVHLYKENNNLTVRYTDRIKELGLIYDKRIDSLNKLIIEEKERSKKEVVEKLEEIIEEQKKTIDQQRSHRSQQGQVVTINNKIIQSNSQKIKQLNNE